MPDLLPGAVLPVAVPGRLRRRVPQVAVRAGAGEGRPELRVVDEGGRRRPRLGAGRAPAAAVEGHAEDQLFGMLAGHGAEIAGDSGGDVAACAAQGRCRPSALAPAAGEGVAHDEQVVAAGRQPFVVPASRPVDGGCREAHLAAGDLGVQVGGELGQEAVDMGRPAVGPGALKIDVDAVGVPLQHRVADGCEEPLPTRLVADQGKHLAVAKQRCRKDHAHAAGMGRVDQRRPRPTAVVAEAAVGVHLHREGRDVSQQLPVDTVVVGGVDPVGQEAKDDGTCRRPLGRRAHRPRRPRAVADQLGQHRMLAVGLEGREVWAAPDLIGGGGQRRTVHQQEHSREPPGQQTRAAEAP